MALEHCAIDAIVEHDQAAVAQIGADLAQRLEAERRVEVPGVDEASERAADLNRADHGSVPGPASELLEDPAQRRAELDLVGAWVAKALVQADDLRPPALAHPELRVGGPASGDDPRHRGERLDVVDDRGPMQISVLGRVWRPCGHLASQALDRVDQRSLLAGDVGAGALEDLDVEAGAGAEEVGAELTPRPRLRDGRPQRVAGPRVLGAHIDDPPRRPGSEGGEAHAREHAVGITLHQEPIDERSRIALVPVADQVAISVTRRFCCRAPLDRGGEAGAAATAQARGLDLATDAVVSAAPHDVLPDLPGLGTGSSDAGEHDRLRHLDRDRDRDLGVARVGPAGELIDQVGTRARLLVVERGRAAVAVAEAVDGLDRDAAVLGDAADRGPERHRDRVEVGAGAGRKAGGPGADPDVSSPARGGGEVGVEGGGTVDVRARQPQLGGDPIDVGGLDSPRGRDDVAKRPEDVRPAATVAPLQLGHGSSRHLPGNLRRSRLLAIGSQHRSDLRATAQFSGGGRRPPSHPSHRRLLASAAFPPRPA